MGAIRTLYPDLRVRNDPGFTRIRTIKRTTLLYAARLCEFTALGVHLKRNPAVGVP